MKEKGILKFKGEESKGAMHYVIHNNQKVSITMGTSRKVKHIRKNKGILIAPNLLSRKFEETKISINDDKSYVKEVFDYMTQLKNIHYKEWHENLVVLQYH